jgi:hypothetical protein
MDLSDIDEPKVAKSNTETEAPMRAKLRSDSALPICTKSITASEEAKRDMPKTDIEEPRRPKLLSAKAEPR